MSRWIDWIKEKVFGMNAKGKPPPKPKPNPKPIPPPPLSADGSHITAGEGGSLITMYGTFTFGTGGEPGGAQILLNGTSAAGGSAVELWYFGGEVYALNIVGAWFLWNNAQWWQLANAPAGYVPPTPPEPEPEPIPPEPLPEPEPPTQPGIVARVRFGDGVLIDYTNAGAASLGTGTEPFQARTVRRFVPQTHPEKKWFSVIFEIDTDGQNPRATFHWGELEPAFDQPLSQPGLCQPQPAYSVTMFVDGVQMGAEINVPTQIWLTQWTWPVRAYPTAKRTRADLVGVVPPIKPGVATQPKIAAVTPYVPLGTSNWTTYFPMTGYHADIGPMPEALGGYLGGDDTLLTSVFDTAEAGFSFPWCITDPQTHNLWDFRQYPNTTFDGRQQWSNPQIAAAYVIVDGLTIDSSHAPCATFLAAALTGDFRWLEITQKIANWHLSSDPQMQGANSGLFSKQAQTRAAAWTFMNVLMAWSITKYYEDNGAVIPPWLMPSSYFAHFLQKNADDIIANYVNNTSKKTRLFRSLTNPGSQCFWQESFFGVPTELAAKWGAPGNWTLIADWRIEGVLPRYDGLSGWPKTNPHGALYLWGYTTTDSWLGVGETKPWADLYAAQPAGSFELPADGTSLVIIYDYPVHDRANMALYLTRKPTDARARACYDYVHNEHIRQGAHILQHWAFAP